MSILDTCLKLTSLHKASLDQCGEKRIRLLELQAKDQELKRIRKPGLKDGCKKTEEMLHYQGLSYFMKAICIKLISHYYDNTLVD